MPRETAIVTTQISVPDGNMDDLRILSSPSKLRMAFGIATRGRPSILRETLQDLREQQRAPDLVVVAYAELQDIGNLKETFPRVMFIQSLPGLTRQRNAILRALQTEDIVIFLDDDFYLHPSYSTIVEAVFAGNPNIVVATGNVLADGINSAGLTFQEAKTVLAHGSNDPIDNGLHNVFNAYGCNMCLRLSTIREHQLTFDEALPLYGWYEDVEFSRQLSPYGRIVKIPAALGVHLGVKSGRQSGVRLGYSQIANPVYLARKRSVPWTYAIASMLSRSIKNAAKCLNPEPFVDRQGRLQGNLKAWRDLVERKIHPTRILDL